MSGNRTGPPRYVHGFDLTGEATPLPSLLRDVARSSELIRTLARKDFFVRYRRASFGVVWAVAVPLLQAGVLAFIFSRIVRFDDVSPYPVYVYSGIVAWSFFNVTVGGGSTSIVDGSSLSTKIYFPRSVFPLVSVTTQAYASVPNVAVLLLLALALGVTPGLHFLLLVPAVLALVLLATSMVLVLSALHVYFRDTRYLVQAALMVWFYATPVIYPIGRTGRIQTWIEANPMTGVVELFHAATTGTSTSLGRPLAFTAAWVVVLAVTALVLHRRFDRVFIDLL